MKLSPKLKQTIFASSPMLNFVTVGMMYAYPAILTPALLSEKGDDVKADINEASWLASTPGISGLIAVFSVGPLMHIYGRKPTLYFTTSVVLLGWILTSIAHNMPTLIVGRALQGVSGGCYYFYSICIGELSCPSIRGVVLNTKVLAVSIGILLVHSFGCFLHWRKLAQIGTLPGIIALIITYFCPETPDWLISRGRFAEAETAFYIIRGHSIEAESEIKRAIEAEKKRLELADGKDNLIGSLRKLRSKALWRPVTLLCCAIVIPEAGGRHFFPAYSLQLAEQIAGDGSKGLLYTIINDVISVVAACVSIVLTNKFSRRKLLLSSGFTANGFLLLSCLLMYLRKNFYDSDVLMWVSLCTLGIYFAIVYGSTFGVSFTLMGELFPLEFRAIGTIIDGAIACLALVIVIKITPILKDSLDIHGMFFVFSCCMLLALTYMYYDLPETKDRTLHDIGEYFRSAKDRLHGEISGDTEETATFILSTTK